MFELPTYADWHALATKSLKGKPLKKVLKQRTADDFDVCAFECADNRNSLPQSAWRLQKQWLAGACYGLGSPEIANKQILDDLAGGINAITLIASPEGFCLEAATIALKDVQLDMVHLGFVGLQGDAVKSAVDVFTARGASSVSLGLDILSAEKLSFTENIPAGYSLYVANALALSEAGATKGYEVASGIGLALEALKALEISGLSLQKAAALITLKLAANGEVFANIAKFRAARRLWNRVLEGSGIPANTSRIEAQATRTMFSTRDIPVNALRNSAAAFGAALGGADQINLMPHDLLTGETAAARRLARHTQAILLEESHLSRVADPAFGSYSIETLTDKLEETALDYLKKFEAMGGVRAAFAAGQVAEDCASFRAARNKQLASRRIELTGVSAFPNADEQPVDSLIEIESESALAIHRDADAFEALRAKGDAFRAKHGRSAEVTLITLGSAGHHMGRMMFAKGFFELAGFVTRAVALDDLDTTPDSLACLCGSDTLYETLESATIEALVKSHDLTSLMIAGKPNNLAALQKVGVSAAIAMGDDVLAANEALWAVLGDVS